MLFRRTRRTNVDPPGRRAGRCVSRHRLAGVQSARCRRAGDPGPGQGRGRRARLQPEPGRPVACPRPHRQPRHRRARHRQLLLGRHRERGSARGAAGGICTLHRGFEPPAGRGVPARTGDRSPGRRAADDHSRDARRAVRGAHRNHSRRRLQPRTGRASGDPDPGRRRDESGGRTPARVGTPRDRLSRGTEGVLERDARSISTTRASRPVSGQATSSWPAWPPRWSPSTTRSRWA